MKLFVICLTILFAVFPNSSFSADTVSGSAPAVAKKRSIWGDGGGKWKWENTPAGALPASRIGVVEPHHLHTSDICGGGGYRESGTYVYVAEVYGLDGTVTRTVVKQPYKYSGQYREVRYYTAPTVDDIRGYRLVGVVSGNPSPVPFFKVKK